MEDLTRDEIKEINEWIDSTSNVEDEIREAIKDTEESLIDENNKGWNYIPPSMKRREFPYAVVSEE